MKKLIFFALALVLQAIFIEKASCQTPPAVQETVKQVVNSDTEEYEYAKVFVVYVYKFWTKDPDGMMPRTLRVLYPDGSQTMLDCSETEAINKLAKEGYRIKSFNSTNHHDGFTMYINDYLMERKKHN